MKPGKAPILEVDLAAPAPEALQRAADVLDAGGVVAFPTDTLYAIGCAFGKKAAIERINRIRGIDESQRPLTFLLADLGELPHYVRISDASLRILGRIFPGPYCAELLANQHVSDPVVTEARRAIGVRVPDAPLCQKLLWRLGRAILSASAKSREGEVLTSAVEIQQSYGPDVDLIINGGTLVGPACTLISLTEDKVKILREGRGPSNRLTS